MPVFVLAPLYLVERVAALGPRTQLAMTIPEIGRQFGEPGVEQVEIVERAIVLVILGGDAVDRRLDAKVDVFRHQRDRHLRTLLAQRKDRGEDLIVRQRSLAALGRSRRRATTSGNRDVRVRSCRAASPCGCLSSTPSSICRPLPFSISSLMKRLTWRALRAVSDVPFFAASSSSSTVIGRNTSCSSKRNSAVGSCISTFVSSA